MIMVRTGLVGPRVSIFVKGEPLMKKFFALLGAVLAAALAPMVAAAQTPAAQPSHAIFITDAAAERIPNLDLLKAELKSYHDCTCTCGCYAHDLNLQADRAIAFLRSRAAHRRPHEKLAMILDIDETSLSNYKELLQSGFTYRKPEFDAWVNSAQAPAIPGTLRLYREAQRLGVAVFFITGRPTSQRAATERNLRAQGYEHWQNLILRPPSTGSESVDAFKSAARARIAAQGYTLILNVGDQWSDLKGTPEAEYNVKYPDPFYYLP